MGGYTDLSLLLPPYLVGHSCLGIHFLFQLKENKELESEFYFVSV